MENVRVILAFSNMLFSEGIRRILAGVPNINVVDILRHEKVCQAETLKAKQCDILLVDITTLYNSFLDIEKVEGKPKVILLDTNCGKENIITAVLEKRLSGVLLGHESVPQMLKAIETVLKGQIWLDNTTVKGILESIGSINSEHTEILTRREKEIVKLIGDGFRNREIAYKLNISEPTVKTHLQHIFKKLHIRSRGELIAYAIKGGYSR